MQKRVGPETRRGTSAKRSEKTKKKERAQREARREDDHKQHEKLTKAIVRSHNGEAQGPVDWKRDGWPDAKFEGKSAKCDL